MAFLEYRQPSQPGLVMVIQEFRVIPPGSGSPTPPAPVPPGVTRIMTRDMSQSGQFAGNISLPFEGVALRANGDRVSFNQFFANNRHTFRLRGASNNNNPAQVELRIGGQSMGVFQFRGTTPTYQEITVTHNRGGGSVLIELVCVNDNGTWDAFVHYLDIFTP